ncbi:MAG: tetratricopeptide repeat protein [Chthonomonas sp.]|nr:tetratricopeptide repeat protein [Chthonomonas sp.]
MIKRTLSLALALAGVHAFAAPECLVVQALPGQADAEVWVADDLAQAIDLDGRVLPITWTETDALWRRMKDNSRTKYPARATEKSAIQFANEFRIPYLVIVTAVRTKGGIAVATKAFRNGSEIWKHGFIQQISVNMLSDRTSDALSVAQTLSILLAETPFKGLPARPKIDTPKPEEGTVTQPVGPGPAHEIKPIPATPQARASARKLVDEGRYAEAIAMIRELVDSNPLDPGVREDLVQALMASNDFATAAATAESSATIIPPGTRLWLLAARAHLRMGKMTEAQTALNQALARDGDGHMAGLIRGEIALLKGEPARAVEAYQEALKTKDSGDAHFGLALAYAFDGQTELAEAEWNKAPKPTAAEVNEFYARLVILTEQHWERVVAQVRESMAAALEPKRAPQVLEKAIKNANVAQGLEMAIRRVSVPARHIASHAKRELAHKLLVQATSDAIALVQRGDEDLVNDIAITLGDAIRKYKLVQAETEVEMQERDDRSFPNPPDPERNLSW